jgi:hypothetical protein
LFFSAIPGCSPALPCVCSTTAVWHNAQAQTAQREFPENALRGGDWSSRSPPQITLNGKPDRLSPGARINGPEQHCW